VSSHIGIIHNERVDVLAKEAFIGESYDNSITNRELISSLQGEYANIDNHFGPGEDRALVGDYYLNLLDIKFKFLRKISRKKNDCGILIKLVTGYSYTRAYLHKMSLADLPKCMCNYDNQDISYIFWSCPKEERKLIYDALRVLKLQDPFSVGYLLGNLNKKKLLQPYLNT